MVVGNLVDETAGVAKLELEQYPTRQIARDDRVRRARNEVLPGCLTSLHRAVAVLGGLDRHTRK
jgi:hypothetical protein